MTDHSRSALIVALSYVLLASAWIILSDHFVSATMGDPVLVERASMAKGLAFVVTTGVLVYLLLARELRRRARLEAERLRAAAERAAILDALPAHVALLDRSGRILAVNSAWRRFAERNGLDASDGGIGLDYLATCDRATGRDAAEARSVAAALREMLAGTRTSFELEYPCARPGEERWFHLSVTPTSWSDPEGLVVMHVDVTQRHQALRAIRIEAEAQRALARVGHELIDAFNTPRLIGTLCEVVAAVLGCSSCRTYLWEEGSRSFVPIAAWGHTDAEWQALSALRITLDDLAMALPELEREGVLLAECARIFRPPLAHAARAGDSGYRLLVVLAHDARLVGMLSATPCAPVVPLDVGRRRVAQGIAQLASLALRNFGLFEELGRAHRAKSEFVATISHELRTPLNVILGYAGLLADGTYGALRSEQADVVARIGHNARQLSELIGNSLDLSRLESGHSGLAVTEVALPELLAEIEGDLRDLSAGTEVALRFAVPPDTPTLATDRAKLKIVLRNLIGNALKFTERGSVTVAVAALPDEVELSVTDTGIGIAPELLPAVFEPFRQGAASTTRGFEGVGLGLYLVRRLVDDLGGRIAVESEVGVGTTFRVLLARRPPGAALRAAS